MLALTSSRFRIRLPSERVVFGRNVLELGLHRRRGRTVTELAHFRRTLSKEVCLAAHMPFNGPVAR